MPTVCWALLVLGVSAPAAAAVADDTPPMRPTLTQGRLIHPTSDGHIPVRLAAGRIAGRWLGQDRHDLVGDRSTLGPNGVQDIHIALAGLPPRLDIAAITINGYGGDEWKYPAQPGQSAFSVILQRKPRSATADLFFEPNRVETGRAFVVKLKFSDGSEFNVDLRGGKADPNLRTPDASLAALWAGQEKLDHAGLGGGVGPDGLQDARIFLERLSKREKLLGVEVEGPNGARWASGTNPGGGHGAELVTDPKRPGEGHFFFQPDRDLTGQTLRVTARYENDRSDSATVKAGKTDPNLAAPRPNAPKVTLHSVKSQWLGQDGPGGSVRVVVNGLVVSRALAGAVLSDGVRGTWVFRASDRARFDTEPDARPLEMKRGSARNSVELSFPPYRDETGATMSLRLVDGDGNVSVAEFPGGACDPARLAPRPEGGETVARPGDDLNALAARGGTLRLAPGEHNLNRPLVLERPITVAGEPGAVLKFHQDAGSPEWTAAIKIHSGGTTLKGFAVRFVGPVRWKTDVSWGPAVIGTTDNLDNRPQGPLVGLAFENLDLIGPPASKPSGWEEAPKLMRLLNASAGRIVGNTLLGGVVEFFHGPWLVENNTSHGTQAASFSPGVFAGHEPHDVVVRNNRVKPAPLTGKTWRFVLFTGSGYADRVENNTVEGVGPRDDDSIPSMNQPEIVLTESYRLRFEGKPAAVSADGRVVRLPRHQGEAPRTGDAVAVVSGTGAGEWRRVAQRLEPTLLLLDAPLPKGAEALSVASGFVGQVYSGNAIDARGGRSAAGVVLAGNHFGTAVLNNKVVGPGEAFRIMAAPSEEPVTWGWSHAPFLGGRFEGNVIEDSEQGARFGVEHSPAIRSNRGRVYMTFRLKGNTVRWSEAFLARSSPAKGAWPGITLGYRPCLDPGEFLVEVADDRLESPRGSNTPALRVEAATVNGRAVTGREFPLPLTPSATAADASRPRGALGPGAAPRR